MYFTFNTHRYFPVTPFTHPAKLLLTENKSLQRTQKETTKDAFLVILTCILHVFQKSVIIHSH